MSQSVQLDDDANSLQLQEGRLYVHSTCSIFGVHGLPPALAWRKYKVIQHISKPKGPRNIGCSQSKKWHFQKCSWIYNQIFAQEVVYANWKQI